MDPNSISKLMLTKYTVKQLTVLPEAGEPIDISEMCIIDIMIQKDYENNNFPILMIDVILTSEDYNKIIADIKTNTVMFKLDKFEVSATENVGKVDSAKRHHIPVINETFIMLTDPIDTNVSKNIPDTGTRYIDNIDKYTDHMRMFLFKEDDLNRYKSKFNEVLNGANMISIIARSLGQRGMSNVLISPPNNNRSYSQVIIPPYTMIGVLRYMQYFYGIWEKGYTYFQDYDCLYIIDNNKVNTAKRSGEDIRVKFEFLQNDNVNDADLGYINENGIHMFRTNSPPDITDNTSQLRNAGLDKVRMMNQSGSYSELSIDEELVSKNSGDVKYLEDKYGNIYPITSAIYSLEEARYMLDIMLMDIDYTILTLNKEYITEFALNDPAYFGFDKTYKISTSITRIYRQENIFYSSTTTVRLKSS